MVHADTTAEEFDRMQKERGEIDAHPVRAARCRPRWRPTMTGNADASAASGLDTFGLIRILMSRDSAAEFKKALAKMLAQTESLTATMEGERRIRDSQRTQRGGAEERSRKCCANKKQRRIAVFLRRARTCAGIEASLMKDMKAKASGEEWLAAWTMPK